MNFKPILFSTPMIQAILNGSKTQTRRIVKITARKVIFNESNNQFEGESGRVIKCPYGQIGDVLWVREAWNYSEFMFHYRSECDNIKGLKWKPSIFMPKEACRLFLKIKNIRVEKLQDITEEDAIAEGAKHGRYLGIGHIGGSIREGYFELWEHINGQCSVLDNPLVWVIEFERIEKPESFI